MNSLRFPRLFCALFVLGSLPLAGTGLRAGSDPAPASPAQDGRPAAVQMDEYLKAQHIEHSVEAPAAANGQATTVKIYGVASSQQQESICAGLSAGGKRDRLQGVSVKFLTLTGRGTGTIQSFEPSSLPSGNGNVTTQRFGDKPEYRVQRTVKLQELVSK